MPNNELGQIALANRHPVYPISELFTQRWSPRAMTGESLNDEELLPLFEAARWAPSSFNGQPWRFIAAKRDTPEWAALFNLMGEFNQSWTKNAAALVVIISRTTFEHNDQPARTHSFDTGSAWAMLALEGARRGLVVHGMEGFDYDRARQELGLPQDYAVEAMAAIGKLAPKEILPLELQDKERPSDRKPLHELIFKGKFGAKYLE